MKPIMAALVSLKDTTLNDFEKHYLATHNPAGVVLFKRNITSKSQLKTLTQSIRETVEREDILIAIDQEGGRVCRLGPPHWPTYASQYTLGAINIEKAKEATQLHGFLIAHDLKEVGINMNFAPVLDRLYPDTTLALKSRCFSNDSKIITCLGDILSKTLSENGICPCFKHLPGHGRAKTDPHLNLPILETSKEDLMQDIYPFKALADKIPAGMTAHIVLPEWDNRPATQSEKIISELIRHKIGFNGFLISDALDMQALTGSLSDRATASLNAGCDCVCYAFAESAGLTELATVVPPLSDQGLIRLTAITNIIKKTTPLTEITTKRHRYETLLSNAPILKTDYDAVEILNQMTSIPFKKE